MLSAVALAAGVVAGGIGGLLASLLALASARWVNRRRTARGLAPHRNEIRPPLHLPGALLGGIVGVAASTRTGLAESVLAALLVPLAAWGFSWALGFVATRPDRE